LDWEPGRFGFTMASVKINGDHGEPRGALLVALGAVFFLMGSGEFRPVRAADTRACGGGGAASPALLAPTSAVITPSTCRRGWRR
jgi:hypothetical protein